MASREYENQRRKDKSDAQKWRLLNQMISDTSDQVLELDRNTHQFKVYMTIVRLRVLTDLIEDAVNESNASFWTKINNVRTKWVRFIGSTR